MRRDVFQGIADPTRREIITVLARQSMNLHSVAEQFKISRPAISKHIKILSECGMVVVHRKGREKLCEANLGNLHKVDEWMEKVRGFWGARLDALGEFLNHPVAHANPKKRKK